MAHERYRRSCIEPARPRNDLVNIHVIQVFEIEIYQSKSLSTCSETVARMNIVPDALCTKDVPQP